MDRPKRKLYRGTLCVIHKEGKYLMEFQENDINSGCWIFPGGGYNLTPDGTRTELGIECASRETREETPYKPLRPRLIALIFFDNRFRIFPGKTEVADFDYDARYYYSQEFEGEFNERGPEGHKIGWFTYEQLRELPMHEGDRRILEAIVKRPEGSIIDGVIVHRGDRLERADFALI